VLVVALFGILLSVGLRGERVFLKPRLVIWAAVLLYSAYVVRIGGDFVHYRYLAFPVCALVLSFGGTLDFAISKWSSYPRLVGALLGVAGMTFWSLSYPSQLDRHPLTIAPAPDALHRYGVGWIEDAARHRSRLDLQPSTWKTFPASVRSRAGEVPYTKILSHGWCRLAYERLDTYFLHSLGLTEPVLARVSLPWAEPHPGHRWDVSILAIDLERLRSRSPMAEASPNGIMSQRLSAVDDVEWPSSVAEWLRRSRPELARIERKIYNQHDFIENLKLALQGPIHIAASESDIDAARQRWKTTPQPQ
jgi:hypothetical protein